MSKLISMPFLLLAGCLCAGLYGMLHNQISYTVSSDYFHAFKFDQFELPANLRNRLGASIVGWGASWWMGVFIGLPLILFGLVVRGARNYVVTLLQAYVVATLTTFAVGLAALMYTCLAYDQQHLPPYGYPPGVVDEVAFARAGTMHNASYSGGAFSIGAGCGYIVWRRRKLARLQGSPQVVFNDGSRIRQAGKPDVL